MKSIKQTTREYNQIVKEHQGKPIGVNCYKCEVCDHVTKTIDIDLGVTPLVISCEACKKVQAKSTSYKDIVPEKEPTFEWYRPNIKEVLKLRKKSHMLNHILAGGLKFRKITTEKGTDE